eukprot:TRINITY_DN5102_c0_g1_i1.p1 TRINITY_DN5102_c0_g1~~TRINITY_DN5102_c0_g1_i1.p1  ORF type:complete len:269 (-),score=43.34 TRINITY_DN5102_c0_g1_i1:44-850(-)
MSQPSARLVFPSDIEIAPTLCLAYCDIGCAGLLALHSLGSTSAKVFEIQVSYKSPKTQKEIVVSLPSGISSKYEAIKPVQIKTFYSETGKPNISFLTVNSKLPVVSACIFVNLLMDWIVWSSNVKLGSLIVLSSLPPSHLPRYLSQNKKYYSLSFNQNSVFEKNAKPETLNDLEKVPKEKGLKLKEDGFLSTLLSLSLVHGLPTEFIFVTSSKVTWRTPLSTLLQGPKDLTSLFCEVFTFLKRLSDEQLQSYFVIHNTELEDDSNLYL